MTTDTASAWLQALDAPDGGLHRGLAAVYGADPDVLQNRMALLRRVLSEFARQYGDEPVRVFRAPGRINLRGMHVDTHGGYLNLMTHQREVVVVASAAQDDTVKVANIDARFEPVSFQMRGQTDHPAFSGDWLSFITHPDIQGGVRSEGGHWGNYIRGCLLSAQHRFPEAAFHGLHAVVGSDVPRGAALSSSAALCTSLLLAILGLHGRELSQDDLILAARDGEWYTGSRCGVSDQAAMVLGGRDALVNVALLASDFDTSGAQRVPFPDGLRILVINSFTERSLSGEHIVDYTRNRFAYSPAMGIVRQELRALGAPEGALAGMDRLSAMTVEALAEAGGEGAVYRLLRHIPEEIAIAALRERYDLPNLDAAYEQYFGTAPEEKRPTHIGLRGPLLFGIAESERARVFLPTLEAGDFDEAGRLMSIGHDGDRRVNADGAAYRYDVSDAALEQLAASGAPVHECPGVYGASSPALDALVDAALEAGALGASLTGAGIAGVVLALCRAEDADAVAGNVRARLASEDYAVSAGRDASLAKDELADAVVVNHATAAAGELGLA